MSYHITVNVNAVRYVSVSAMLSVMNDCVHCGL